jgi:hypothetical protein
MAKANMECSLEELEKDYWQDSASENDQPTTLVKKVYLFRKIPLKDLEPGQIRLLIGQDVGIQYLLPLALNILEKNPYTECDFFSGDLLKCVAGIDMKYWADEKDLYEKFCGIMTQFDKNDGCENWESCLPDEDKIIAINNHFEQTEKPYYD